MPSTFRKVPQGTWQRSEERSGCGCRSTMELALLWVPISQISLYKAAKCVFHGFWFSFTFICGTFFVQQQCSLGLLGLRVLHCLHYSSFRSLVFATLDRLNKQRNKLSLNLPNFPILVMKLVTIVSCGFYNLTASERHYAWLFNKSLLFKFWAIENIYLY